jgi:hypothetical protein
MQSDVGYPPLSISCPVHQTKRFGERSSVLLVFQNAPLERFYK